jgi:hypothetical protein
VGPTYRCHCRWVSRSHWLSWAAFSCLCSVGIRPHPFRQPGRKSRPDVGLLPVRKLPLPPLTHPPPARLRVHVRRRPLRRGQARPHAAPFFIESPAVSSPPRPPLSPSPFRLHLSARALQCTTDTEHYHGTSDDFTPPPPQQTCASPPHRSLPPSLRVGEAPHCPTAFSLRRSGRRISSPCTAHR